TNALYRREPYADNYVPPIFLERLVTNGNRRHVRLRVQVEPRHDRWQGALSSE
ncbi:unnamed protein product, partial [Ascophyllum nodosum]